MEEKKNNKHRLTKTEREERKFNKDLKDCMRCKFFWGNDSRCINSNSIIDEDELECEHCGHIGMFLNGDFDVECPVCGAEYSLINEEE